MMGVSTQLMINLYNLLSAAADDVFSVQKSPKALVKKSFTKVNVLFASTFV